MCAITILEKAVISSSCAQYIARTEPSIPARLLSLNKAFVKQQRGLKLFNIEDSGDGIPSKLHETVKQRFYRANDQRAEGSALGLAIAENVVTEMQWQWDISQSDLGGLKQTIHFNKNPA